MADSDWELDMDKEDVNCPKAKRRKGEAKGGKKKAVHRPMHFSSAEEADLVQWVEDNPFLFNSKLENFRDPSKKIAVYVEKAKQFPHKEGCTGATLARWVSSLRTQYGKLNKKRSGSSAHRYTDRELWVLKAFEFLNPFIVRRRTNLTKPSGFTGQIELDGDSNFTGFDSDASSSAIEPKITTAPRQEVCQQVASSETSQGTHVCEDMMNLLKSNLQRDHLSPEEAELRCFGDMLMNRIRAFPKSVRPDVQAELYSYLLQLRYDPRFQESDQDGFLTTPHEPKVES